MKIKPDTFQAALVISILLHASVLLFSSFSAVEGEIDPEEYKLVQLMDLTPASSRESREAEGEIRISQDQKTRKDDFPKEENFSLYLPFFKVVKLPQFIVKIKPEYPSSARMKEQESEVLVEVYIDDRGRVRKVSVLRSGGAEFDSSVVRALSRSEFLPAVDKDGKPVACRVRIPYKFELE